MTNITRRTALQGAGAALAAAGLSVAQIPQTPASELGSEPAPLADVTTRLGMAMDEVSALLAEWSEGGFRAIIEPGGRRNYWLQGTHLDVPARTDALIEAWLDEHDKLMDVTRRLRVAAGQRTIDHLSNIRMSVSADENMARNAMLRSLLRDRRDRA